VTNLKSSIAAVAAGVALLSSPVTFAGSLTGYVGVVSDYLFRGQESSDGAALQGGVDWSIGSGLYAGLWTSNTVDATNEFDLYAGWSQKLGDFTVDAGVIGYLFSENEERFDQDINYAEVYVGGAVGPISLKVFYAYDYYNSDDAALYITAAANLPLTDTIAFNVQAGISDGDGVEKAVGDSYTDYGVSVTKKLKDELSVSLGVYGTDLEEGDNGFLVGTDDQPKVILGVKKGFEI
jgi:uncharacterized protein (TIGR02001 family)